MMQLTLVRSTRLMLFAGLCLTTLAASLLAAPPAGYMDFAAITSSINDLKSNPNCKVDVIGTTAQNRDVFVLTLSDDPSNAGNKPALLITAGLDARHRVGPETALRVAKRLLADHADLLKDTTIYIIPCANPDGMEYNDGTLNFGNPRVNYGHIGNLHPVDDDRDFAIDEDGPQDLNGDGVITQMRRLNPPLDDTATMMADPAAPRLLKKPNAEKGERATYSIYVEGLDVDGDGKLAEDAIGSVDLDRNFMHRWPEHDNDAGEYQLSEPESAALAKFVLEHRNIVEAITYGRHDNLINTPDSKAKDITGEGPKDLDSGDADYYKEIGKLFKDTTGQERAPANDTAGSFHVWLYAERGIPSFATVVWGRPEASKPKEAETKPADSQPATQPADAPATQPALNMPASQPSFNMSAMSDDVELVAVADDEMQQPPAGGGGRRGGRRPGGAPREGASGDAASSPSGGGGGGGGGGGSGGGEKKDDKPKPADAEAAAWLDYSDRDRNHEGFIEWTAFDHPSLGKVEIGGFVPGFQMNPPADQLDTLAEKQTKFVVEMLKKQPKIVIEGPVVKKLAPGLYEVRFGMLNDGYLPTTTAMARRARSIMPTNVRISTPIESIVTGDRLSKVFGITGGERWSTRWILRADDGSEIVIEMTNPQLGDQKIVFKAEERS